MLYKQLFIKILEKLDLPTISRCKCLNKEWYNMSKDIELEIKFIVMCTKGMGVEERYFESKVWRECVEWCLDNTHLLVSWKLHTAFDHFKEGHLFKLYWKYNNFPMVYTRIYLKFSDKEFNYMFTKMDYTTKYGIRLLYLDKGDVISHISQYYKYISFMKTSIYS